MPEPPLDPPEYCRYGRYELALRWTPSGVGRSAVFAGGWTTPAWGPVRLVEGILARRPDWRLTARVDSLTVLRRVS